MVRVRQIKHFEMWPVGFMYHNNYAGMVQHCEYVYSSRVRLNTSDARTLMPRVHLCGLNWCDARRLPSRWYSEQDN